MENTSGQGKASVVPAEIKGWNWGAMMMNWVWGLFNGTFIALLMFVPFVNFFMFFVLGAKGNEWAWRNKKWDSVEHFKSVQRKWAIAGLIILVLGVAAGVGSAMLATSVATSATE
ncbi:MAG: ribonuclease G [Burkholderiales bacterium PBB4]|nr:MAG: ribonuclease G [Burkholderiales bacterium PBB4]